MQRSTPIKLSNLFGFDAPGASQTHSDATESLLTRFLVDAGVLDEQVQDISEESYREVRALYCAEREKAPAGSEVLPARTLKQITDQSIYIVQTLGDDESSLPHPKKSKYPRVSPCLLDYFLELSRKAPPLALLITFSHHPDKAL